MIIELFVAIVGSTVGIEGAAVGFIVGASVGYLVGREGDPYGFIKT